MTVLPKRAIGPAATGVFLAIAREVQSNGRPPTLRQIARRQKLPVGAVIKAVSSLEEEGLVERVPGIRMATTRFRAVAHTPEAP